MSKHLKNIGVISFLTLASRFLGLARESIQFAVFGAGELLSAFTTANIFPNLFRRLLAEGSLTAAFIPTMQEELHHHGREGAFSLISKVTSWLTVISGGLAVLAMAAFSHSRIISGEPDRWYVAADLAVLLFPYLAMISLAAAFCAALNVLDHYTEPALNPIWLNLSIIGSLAVAAVGFSRSPMGQIHWLCAGWLLGGFLQMAIPAIVLIRLGWRPRFDLGIDDRVREIAGLMTPGIIGLSIYQVNFSVSRLLAFSLDDSSAVYLYGVNRLVEVPQGVFAVAVSTVVYQLIAKHAVQGNHQALADDFRKGIRFILIINIPAAAGLAILSRPIVELILRHGKTTTAAAHDMGILLAVMVASIPFFSVAGLAVRTFYAIKDTATPVKIAGVDFLVNVVVTVVLVFGFKLGVVGIAIAGTTAIIAQTVLLAFALRRRFPHLGLGRLLPSLLKVLAGTAVMAVAVAWGWQRVDHLNLGRQVRNAVAIFGLIPLGFLVYAAALWALKVDGLDEVKAVFARFRKRRA